MSRIMIFVSLALAACLVMAAAGCGKKTWPEPRAEQDRFQLVQPRGELAGDCLTVTVSIEGAWSNLAALTVELEPDGDCPGCPFQATRFETFSAPSERFARTEKTVHATICGLEKASRVRWRVRGENVHDTITPVVSAETTTQRD